MNETPPPLMKMKLPRVLALAAALWAAMFLAPAPAGAQSNTPNLTTWTTDGNVLAIACTSTTVYLGGSFQNVGFYSGGGAVLNSATGEVQSAFPRVLGTVNACAPDGAGGWYIGGDFSRVGNLARNRVAHILADGRVDPQWDPNANGAVLTLAAAGGKVYAGGAFTTIGGQARNHLAALDAASGSATAWNPDPSGYYDSKVFALAVSGSTVYAGGNFAMIGGQTRNAIAALDAATGAATGWNPNAVGRSTPYAQVYALAVQGATVYAGGDFGSMGDQARPGLAALDTATGLPTAWNPKPDGNVRALAVAGGGGLCRGLLWLHRRADAL